MAMESGFIIPTREEFLLVFNEFPKGSVHEAYAEVQYTITNKKRFDGTPVTWKLISDKFLEYVKKKKDANTEPKWIKSMLNFIKNGDYEIDFALSMNNPTSNGPEKGNFFTNKMNEAAADLKRKLGMKND